MLGSSPLGSPAAVFPGNRINASRLAAHVSQPEPVARNGLSLARNGCPLSKASIPGSMFPACYFAPSSRSASLPVRLFGSTTASIEVAIFNRGCFVASSPLQRLPSGPASCSCDLHSPSGLLPPSGSKRSTALAACPVHLAIPPDCLSLPGTVSISSIGTGSPFLARYDPAG